MSQLKAVKQEEFPLTCRRVSLFVLFSPSSDWVGPTHIKESSLLYSEPADINAPVIQNQPHGHSQDNACPSVWASCAQSCGHIKLNLTSPVRFPSWRDGGMARSPSLAQGGGAGGAEGGGATG